MASAFWLSIATAMPMLLAADQVQSAVLGGRRVLESVEDLGGHVVVGETPAVRLAQLDDAVQRGESIYAHVMFGRRS